jgi:hydrogenase-4 component E
MILHTALLALPSMPATPARELTGPVQPPGFYTGGANVIAVLVLLAQFGMFRQALLRDQIRLYAVQSGLISVVAVIIAALGNLPELYALAALSAALKVVVIPLAMHRLVRGSGLRGLALRAFGRPVSDPVRIPVGADIPAGTDIAGSGGLGVASVVLLAIAVAALGFFSAGSLGIHAATAPQTALAISAAVVLVSFVLMIHRRDVLSQAVGFFTLENGISLAALVIAATMPLLLEVALLFDLLAASVVFGMMIRLHHARAESLSTAELTSLRG